MALTEGTRNVSCWTCRTDVANGDEVLPQLGPASACALIADCNRQGLPLADQHNQSLPTRHARVQQIACQHHVVLRDHRYYHGRILRSLALMDRRRVRQYQLVKLAETVTHLPAVKGDDQFTCIVIDPLYDAQIAIVDFA